MPTFTGALKPAPFKVEIPQSALDDLKSLIKLGRLPPPTYEGTKSELGISSAWMKQAKEYWQNQFDWRKHEEHINSFPNFTANIKDDNGEDYTIHFIALLSSDPNAVPIILLHGWPGSFLEFLGVIPLLAASKSPAFHIIVASLPGYAFSSPPPIHIDLELHDVARLMDKLMVGLGFGKGYVAQGGDIGSMVARIMGSKSPACKAVHLNFAWVNPPTNASSLPVTDVEKEGLIRGQAFAAGGNAYAMEHATRPSTIGHVLASSPLALLAWIGEKLFIWTDEDPSIDTILESISLYWLTETFPKSLYPYRHAGLIPEEDGFSATKYHINVPLGYSYFPKEAVPIPSSWLGTTGNLVFVRYHEKGGHFAALEVPDLLVKDIVEFVTQVQKDL